MYLVDANVLIYAVDKGSRHHATAHAWITDALNGGTVVVGIPWASALAFLRVTTNPRLFARPLTPDQAGELLRAWLHHPGVVTPEPTPRHAVLLSNLLSAEGTAGNLVTDAHLAALAMEHKATVVTYDRDFQRFPVQLVDPRAHGTAG